MATMIAIPDELVQQVKSVVTTSQAEVEKFFVEAARKRLREIRAKQMEAEYHRTHARLSPRQVYNKMLAEIAEYETKYHMPTDRFVGDFESGIIEDDPFDYYKWRGAYYTLRSVEAKHGFRREVVADVERAV